MIQVSDTIYALRKWRGGTDQSKASGFAVLYLTRSNNSLIGNVSSTTARHHSDAFSMIWSPRTLWKCCCSSCGEDIGHIKRGFVAHIGIVRAPSQSMISAITVGSSDRTIMFCIEKSLWSNTIDVLSVARSVEDLISLMVDCTWLWCVGVWNFERGGRENAVSCRATGISGTVKWTAFIRAGCGIRCLASLHRDYRADKNASSIFVNAPNHVEQEGEYA